MKILLLGKNGQVGWELQRSLASLGELIALDRSKADFSQPDSLKAVILEVKPNIIVNAAAYTAVDKAEEDKSIAQLINAESLKVISETAKVLNAWLVNYSTDYVYSGKKVGSYCEDDETGPLSVYGQTKLAGEEYIRRSGCKFLNFRTSWVFAAKGHNFIKSMLRLGREREQLNIVADQVGAPTSAELIADVTSLAISKLSSLSNLQEETVSGTYHLTAKGEASWHSYAQYIFTKARELGFELRVSPESVYPIKTSEYKLPAPRPANSVLNTQKLESTFSIQLPHWTKYVDRTLEEVILEKL